MNTESPDIATIRSKFIELKCCVIVPTYNNGGTLGNVLHNIMEYTGNLIVVNDGSTDETTLILQSFTNIEIIHVIKNTGKGWALRQGFRRATELGYRYAISIDSDGQHFPEDFYKLLGEVEREPDSLVIGSRNMAQADVPGSSSFGNRFSVFWFNIQTGMKISDAQSGFRLYPLNKISEKKYYTTKYEFEAEVLVRMCWHGVKILSVPVRIWYAPKGERVSHLNKFTDVARISMINTILVFMAVLWVRPFLFARNLKTKSVRGFIREYVIESGDSNAKIALSLGIGLFMGVFPIWGWQMMASLAIAVALRLNKFVTVAASNISIPPFFPLIIFLSYYTGNLVLNGGESNLSFSSGFSLDWVRHNLWQYILGSVIFGLILGAGTGLVTYIVLQLTRRRKNMA